MAEDREPPFTLGEPRRMWNDIDPPTMRVILPFAGRATVAELVGLAAQLGIPQDGLSINHAQHVSWVEPATMREILAREESNRRHAERHEKWERDTYERLRAKFEGQP